MAGDSDTASGRERAARGGGNGCGRLGVGTGKAAAGNQPSSTVVKVTEYLCGDVGGGTEVARGRRANARLALAAEILGDVDAEGTGVGPAAAEDADNALRGAAEDHLVDARAVNRVDVVEEVRAHKVLETPCEPCDKKRVHIGDRR